MDPFRFTSGLEVMKRNLVSLARLYLAAFLIGSLHACSPLDIQPEEHVSQSERPAQPGDVRVTFLGTTTLLVDDGVTRILIDGFLTRPSFVEVFGGQIKTDQVLVKSILKRAGATQVDAIFVTHSHYDHALDVAFIAQETGAKLYGSDSTLNIGRGWLLPESQLVRFETDTWIPIGSFSVRVYPSKHSPPIPFVNDNLGQNIKLPLHQPARESQYVEGGSYDILIAHDQNTMLVKGSANYLQGALHGVHADAVFLAIGGIGFRGETFHKRYYANTIGCLAPSVVVVTHWDSLFAPLDDSLPPMTGSATSLSYMRAFLRADGISLKVLQGFETIRPFAFKDRGVGPAPWSTGCDTP